MVSSDQCHRGIPKAHRLPSLKRWQWDSGKAGLAKVGGRNHSTAEVLGQCGLILEDPSLIQDSFESGDPQCVFLPGGASHGNGRNSRETMTW